VRRDELEHVIAAAADVTGEAELVVVGSQAILGPFPDAPQSMLRSMEADLYPRRAPEKADDIDGSLGDGSRFHRTFGYYAHGVGPETAKAPAGWEMRCSRSASQTASGIGSSRAKRSPIGSSTRRCSSAGSTICGSRTSTVATFERVSKRWPP